MGTLKKESHETKKEEKQTYFRMGFWHNHIIMCYYESGNSWREKSAGSFLESLQILLAL